MEQEIILEQENIESPIEIERENINIVGLPEDEYYKKEEVDELLEAKADNEDITEINDEIITINNNISTVNNDISTIKAEQTVQNGDISQNKADITAINSNLINYSLITETGSEIALNINSSTYVMTAILKDKNGNVIYTSNEIDLPLETMVVGASYDDATKEIVLTLQNGNTVRFSVSDLVSGLVTETSLTTRLTDYVKFTDYANDNTSGVMKVTSRYGTSVSATGTLYGVDKTYSEYENAQNYLFINKGTLENVIAGKDLANKTYVDTVISDLSTTSLGSVSDYNSRANAMNLNELKKGIYVLIPDASTLWVKATYGGATYTNNVSLYSGSYNYINDVIYLIIKNEINDELPINTNFAEVNYELYSGSYYLFRVQKHNIRNENGSLGTGSGSYQDYYFDLTDKEQTITRKKTFTVLPESTITPTTNYQLVNKKYVDDTIASLITTELESDY